MGTSLSKSSECGAGDNDLGANHNDNDNEQSNDLEKLPFMVQMIVLKCLPESDVVTLRSVSNLLKRTIDFDYGVRVTIPALASLWRSPYGRTVMITRGIQQSIMESLGTKVVRILEINEIPPMYNPFPFDTYITRPIRVREVVLVYVNVQLVHQIISKCKFVRSLSYKSSYYPRTIYEAFGWGRLLIPLPIPPHEREFVQIIQTFPAPRAALNKLTSLSLTFDNNSHILNKDWANMMFLMMVLDTPNLRTFNFQQSRNIREPGTCLILVCLSELLRRTPNLITFSYTNPSAFHHFLHSSMDTGEQEISTLIDKYGSLESKAVLEAYPDLERMRTTLKDIMRTIGRHHHAREMYVGISKRIEAICFFEFAKQSCSLETIVIDRMPLIDDEVLDQNQLLLELIIIPVWKEPHKLCSHLRRLKISHNCACLACKLPPLLICDILRKYIALEHFILEERARPIWEEHEFQQGFSVEVILPEVGDPSPVVVRNNRTREYRYTPDIQIYTNVSQEIYPAIHTLILREINVLARDCHFLSKFFNLKKLEILIPPSFQHNSFGLYAQDLLTLLNLRNLNNVLVGKIIFPLDNPELANSLREAVESVGSLFTHHEHLPITLSHELQRYKPLFRI